MSFGIMKAVSMAKSLAPGTFQRTMSVPQAGYRTAIAIKHDSRMTEVSVTFALRNQNGKSAAYAALCPRCNAGEISVAVELNPDGSFAEFPACPTLCIACEDGLDAMLNPGAAKHPAGESQDRATLGKYLKAMTVRPWD